MSEKSKPGNEAKQQHIVPRLHLEHFAGTAPKGQVWTYSKNTPSRRSAIASETATFGRFYSFEREDGSYDNSVDDALTANENVAAPIYQGLIAGEAPKTAQARADFSHFLALLYCRTTASVRDAATLLGRGVQIHRYAYAENLGAFEQLVRKVEAARGETMPPDVKEMVRQRFLDPTGATVGVSREAAMMALNAAPGLAKILFAMRWSIANAAGGFFVTSDNPVVRIVDPKTVHRIYGDGGFMNRTARVTLALDPKTILLLSRDDSIPERFAMGRDGVTAWNWERAYAAEEFLYSHAESDEIAQLAASLQGSRPRMTTEGYGPKTFAPVEMPRKWTE